MNKGIVSTLAAQVDDEAAPSLERLLAAATLQNELDDLLPRLAAAARDDGHTWVELAQLLGVTKQAVQQRFGSFVADLAEGPRVVLRKGGRPSV